MVTLDGLDGFRDFSVACMACMHRVLVCWSLEFHGYWFRLFLCVSRAHPLFATYRLANSRMFLHPPFASKAISGEFAEEDYEFLFYSRTVCPSV